MDITTVIGLAGAAGSAASAVNGLSEAAARIRTMLGEKQIDAELRTAVADLLDRLIAAKLLQLELQEKAAKLIEAAREDDRFDQDATRYSWVATDAGAHLPRLKKPGTEEPDHYLCPVCFAERVIMRLQPGSPDFLRCPRNKEHGAFRLRASEPVNRFRDLGERFA